MAIPSIPAGADATEALAATCQELDSQVSAVSDEQAARFFQVFSLESLFSVFASPTLSANEEACALSVLGKLLKTRTGSTLLPQAVPYFDAALQVPKLSLRRMAVQQYGALLGGASTGHDAGAAVPDQQGQQQQQQQQYLLLQLLTALQDRDTGVAHDAALALASWASTLPSRAHTFLDATSGPLGQRCAELAASDDGIMRLRLLSLVTDIAACGSTGVAAAVQRAGLLQRLLRRELSTAASDPLSTLSALSTVTDLAERWSRPGSIGFGANAAGADAAGDRAAVATLVSQLCSAVVSELPQLLSDPLLLPGALGAAALLLRELMDYTPRSPFPHHLNSDQRQGAAAQGASTASVNGMVIDGEGTGFSPRAVASEGTGFGAGGNTSEGELMDTAADGVGAVVGLDNLQRSVLEALHSILDDRGSAGAQEEEAALDAAGKLAGSWAGAELLLSDPRVTEPLLDRALSRTTRSPDVRIAALHALASAAGLERAAEAGGAAPSGRGLPPTGPLDPSAAALPAHAEQALRVGSYQAAASSGAAQRSPCDVLVSLGAQPVPELAVASYRAAAALALRPWFAAELCSSTALLAAVTDPATTTGHETTLWRQALLASLWATAKAVASLPAGHPDTAHAPTLAAVEARLRSALTGRGGSGRANTLHDTHMVATIP